MSTVAPLGSTCLRGSGGGSGSSALHVFDAPASTNAPRGGSLIPLYLKGRPQESTVADRERTVALLRGGPGMGRRADGQKRFQFHRGHCGASAIEWY